MKVKELIEFLKQKDPEDTVFFKDCLYCADCEEEMDYDEELELYQLKFLHPYTYDLDT